MTTHVFILFIVSYHSQSLFCTNKMETMNQTTNKDGEHDVHLGVCVLCFIKYLSTNLS